MVAEAPAVMVSVELPLPGAAIEDELKLAVTPVGSPETDKDMAALKPPLTLVVMLEEPDVPCARDRLEGDAITVKSAVCAALTVSERVAVCVMPPPVPVTVTFTVPVAAVLPAVSVSVELPGAPTDAGLKLAVTPEGRPEADKETAELKPPRAEIETEVVPEVPWVTDSLEGERLKVKSGGCTAVTVTETIVVWVTPPPAAVTVMLNVPAAATLLAEMVSTELPLPGAAIEVGLKLAVTPEGSPEADSEIAELNPPVGVREMVVLDEAPWFMLTDAGVAVTMKSGVTCFQTSEIAVALAALPACASP